MKKIVDSKGKGRIDSVDEFEFHYTIHPHSFNLGVGSTQPSLLEAMKSKKVQKHIDSVISGLLKETKSTEEGIYK